MKVAVMGHGVVGSGVVEVLLTNAKSIEKKAKEPIEVKYIMDLRVDETSPLKDRFIKDINIILNDDEVKVVAECIGNIEPAYTFVKSCLEAGKSIVTSNKELIAEKGAELLKIAKENKVNLMFEASVGGGIPIIRPLEQCLAANEIDEIEGILNGTTNFILTKMINENMSLDDALALATELGYAEKSDPSADTEGHDACRKVSILASLAFGKALAPKYIKTEGITKIALRDVEYAESWGGVIKLIGRTKRLENDKIFAMVSPCFVSNSNPLSNVDDVFNGILVKGNAIGDCMFYGQGAGKLPTASAVVADIIDCTKHQNRPKEFMWVEAGTDFIADYKENVQSFYVRAVSADKESAYKTAVSLFGKDTFEIKNSKADDNEFAFVTPKIKEKDFEEKIAEFSAKDSKVMSVIRILED